MHISLLNQKYIAWIEYLNSNARSSFSSMNIASDRYENGESSVDAKSWCDAVHVCGWRQRVALDDMPAGWSSAGRLRLIGSDQQPFYVVHFDSQLVGTNIISSVDEDLHQLTRRIVRVIAYLVDEWLRTTVTSDVAVFRREVVQQRHFKLPTDMHPLTSTKFCIGIRL